MIASTLVSEAGGRLSQPVAGAARQQMFLRSTNNNRMSKSFDVTDEAGEGYSLPHCVALMIFLFLMDCRVEWSGENIKTLKTNIKQVCWEVELVKGVSQGLGSSIH